MLRRFDNWCGTCARVSFECMYTNASNAGVRHGQATLNSAYRPEIPNRVELEGRLVPNLVRTHFNPFTHRHFICVRCGCL
jgi:hypothetical protein